VRAFRQQGYVVYPVNPKEIEIEGLPVYKNIRDVPARPQMVSVYVPPTTLLKFLPDIAAKGCDELWLNPGVESGRSARGGGPSRLERYSSGAASWGSACRPRLFDFRALARGE